MFGHVEKPTSFLSVSAMARIGASREVVDKYTTGGTVVQYRKGESPVIEPYCGVWRPKVFRTFSTPQVDQFSCWNEHHRAAEIFFNLKD